MGPFFDRLGKSLVALRQWAESVPIEKTARRPLRQVEVQSATIDRVKLERTAYCRVTLQLDLELRVLIPKDAFVAVKFRTSSLISEEQKVHVHPTALTPAAIVDQNRVRKLRGRLKDDESTARFAYRLQDEDLEKDYIRFFVEKNAVGDRIGTTRTA